MIERLRHVLGNHRGQLLSLQNVVGVGIGQKERQGKKTGELAVTVLVTRKIPMGQLMATESVPRKVGGVVTDVIEVGEISLLSVRTTRLRPAPPGVSIGHYKISAGTFGAVVRDRRTSAPFILSNNHVLANITDGQDGRARAGDLVLQPGRYDGGTEADAIGVLERFVPLWRENMESLCPVARRIQQVANAMVRGLNPAYEVRLLKRVQAENLVDAAVARPLADYDISSDILELGAVDGIREPSIGLRVRKSGRTSGVTTGEIRVVDATIRVLMGDLGTALFTDQIVTTPMAQPGDSGSLVLSEDRRAVGLLSAGSDSASLCGRMTTVLKLLDVKLD